MALVVLICLVSCLNVHVAKSETLNDTKTLIKTLFKTNDYNKKIRPLEDQSDVLNITFSFYLSAITGFNEQEESLSTAGFLRLTWMDTSLTWKVEDYNMTSRISVPKDDIWKPHISLRNSYTTFKGHSYHNAWVMHDGSVFWEPFQVMKSACSVDITYFPYDTHTCDLEFIALSYTKAEINLRSASEVQTIDYKGSSTWELVSSSVMSKNTIDASVTYILKLKRKPLFYVLNIILPVILISILNVVTFVLPVKSGERASYSVTVFLSLAVFSTIVAAESPKTSDTSSLLATYLIMMITNSTIHIIVSVIELRIANRDENEAVGDIFTQMYDFVQIMRCRRRKCWDRKVSDSKISVREPETQGKVTWSDVVDAMDFVFFWFGVVMTFIPTLVLLAMLWSNN